MMQREPRPRRSKIFWFLAISVWGSLIIGIVILVALLQPPGYCEEDIKNGWCGLPSSIPGTNFAIQTGVSATETALSIESTATSQAATSTP